MIGRYFEVSGRDYHKGLHSFVRMGKLAKSKFGPSVRSTEQRVHFDETLLRRRLRIRKKLNFFQLLNFLA